MSSAALHEWQTRRRARLQQLYDAHVAVGGARPGRRTATEQLNWSLALRLAGEFQGFVRDLHDEAATVFVARIDAGTVDQAAAIQRLLRADRALARRNATAAALQKDFNRLGIQLLDELRARYVLAPAWLLALEALNEARNGIAHGDYVTMARAMGGSSLGLRQVRAWHASLRALASACDRVTGDTLAVVTGGSAPW